MQVVLPEDLELSHILCIAYRGEKGNSDKKANSQRNLHHSKDSFLHEISHKTSYSLSNFSWKLKEGCQDNEVK